MVANSQKVRIDPPQAGDFLTDTYGQVWIGEFASKHITDDTPRIKRMLRHPIESFRYWTFYAGDARGRECPSYAVEMLDGRYLQVVYNHDVGYYTPVGTIDIPQIGDRVYYPVRKSMAIGTITGYGLPQATIHDKGYTSPSVLCWHVEVEQTISETDRENSNAAMGKKSNFYLTRQGKLFLINYAYSYESGRGLWTARLELKADRQITKDLWL